MLEKIQFDDNEALLLEYYTTKSIALRNKIVELNLGLVYSVAHRIKDNCSVPLEDLIQVGSIGLIKAIERYDPSRSKKLSSYALPSINGSILMFLRDKSRIIKAPRKLQDIYQRIKKYSKKHSVSQDTAIYMLGIPLHLAYESKSAYLENYQEIERITEIQLEDPIDWDEILCLLPAEHAQIIQLLHLQGYKCHEIRKMLNISNVQIRILESEAINMLKQIMIEKP